MFNSGDLNRIKNHESRINFEFVLQSYYSNNNKAAVLLLYNLVVNDLFSKLVLMNENLYINCRSDLEDIENNLKELNEAKYSLVEEKIFNIYKTKNILNHSTIDLLFYFKKIRNKCAHPFFFKENDYNPTDEEVYLFITKIYNDILIVEAFFKDPYDVMKKDIETFQFPDLESVIFGISGNEENVSKVKAYFSKKYFRYMTDNNFKKLFKNLVDLSICKNSDEILIYQYNHYLLLCSLLDHLKEFGKLSLLNNVYEWNKLKIENIYDDIHKNLREQICFSLTYLFRTLSYNLTFLNELKYQNEEVYGFINESLYDNVYLFIKFWKLFDIDINDAIKKLSNNLKYCDYYEVVKKFKNVISRKNLIILICRLLNKIPNCDAFNKADETLDLIINIMEDINPKFEQDEVENFLKIMNSNRQIYSQSRCIRDSQLIKMKELGYDLDKYENLKLEVVKNV